MNSPLSGDNGSCHVGNRLQLDERIVGWPRYLLASDDDWAMQVPPEILDCVAFVGCKSKKSLDFGGTCFFTAVPATVNTNIFTVYVVTAKHCISEIDLRSTDGLVHLRINHKNGSSVNAAVPIRDWVFHPTSPDTIDVAVLPLQWSEEFQHTIFPVEGFITKERIAYRQFGTGEEVLIPGLFHQHSLKARNIPVVRTGTIAAMPDIPVECKWATMDAFLIDTRSIGGLSGSPVFACFSGMRAIEGGRARLRAGFPQFACIGLVHGHAEEYKVNSGIAIVVPYWRILEVLNQASLRERRDAAAIEHDRQVANGIVPDTGPIPCIDGMLILDDPPPSEP